MAGAPAGHPFFGNQHTDGGYAPGSFSYRAAAAQTARGVGRLSRPIDLTAELPTSRIGALIATGVVAAVVGSGAMAYAYMRNRPNKDCAGMPDTKDSVAIE